ncbi:RAIN protein, partial [Alcedo cyanopectus]|nr:RAIN protein [Ceyx cyanopectus]
SSGTGGGSSAVPGGGGGVPTGGVTPGAGRWSSEKKLAELMDAERRGGLGGGRGGGGRGLGDPPTPQGQLQPPGILKIFGGGVSRGANYKSVLATPRSTARDLVREALERYGLEGGDG